MLPEADLLRVGGRTGDRDRVGARARARAGARSRVGGRVRAGGGGPWQVLLLLGS